MYAFQPFLFNVSIYLSRGYVRVAEHGLYGPKVGSPLKQMRGERVAKHVRGYMGVDAGGKRVVLYDAPEALTAHLGGGSRGYEKVLRTPAAKKSGSCVRKIVPCFPDRGVAYGKLSFPCFPSRG